MVEGLKRAKQTVPDKYGHISKIARKIMREYLGSIFSIKTAERKIKTMEMQEHHKKGEDSLKRQREDPLE